MSETAVVPYLLYNVRREIQSVPRWPSPKFGWPPLQPQPYEVLNDTRNFRTNDSIDLGKVRRVLSLKDARDFRPEWFKPMSEHDGIGKPVCVELIDRGPRVRARRMSILTDDTEAVVVMEDGKLFLSPDSVGTLKYSMRLVLSETAGTLGTGLSESLDNAFAAPKRGETSMKPRRSHFLEVETPKPKG